VTSATWPVRSNAAGTFVGIVLRPFRFQRASPCWAGLSGEH
jgi:hypothetical protein